MTRPDPVPDVLESNLQRLFARAYEPVEPSAEFRGRLRLALEREIVRPQPVAAVTKFPWRVAAAILLLLGGALLGWTMLRRPAAHRGVQEFLSSGLPALREAPGISWRQLTLDEIEHGIELAAALIELATPEASSGRPVRVEIEPEGELEAASGTRVSVGRSDSGSTTAEIAFEEGALALHRRELPGAWRIATSEGDLRLASGRFEIAYVGREPSRRLRVKLLSGAAQLESEPPYSFPTGLEVFLADGIVLGEPKLDEPVKAPERASAAPAEEPQSPPVPSTVAVLRGTLILPGGDALPGSFEVTLLRAKRLPDVSQPFSRTFAGDSGAFEFEKLRPGSYSVFVQVRGYATWVTRGVELSAGGAVDLRCELDPGLALRGLVLDAEGRPVEGALVLAEEDTPVQVLELGMKEAPPGWTAAARSDAEGVFHLPHLLPGRKTLRATLAGHGAGWTEGVDPASIDPADPRGGVEVRLTRAGAIEGRIAHDDGTAWPGANVIVALLDSTFRRPCMSFGSATADEDGRYAAEDLPPGTYVVFNASGIGIPQTAQARVESGERVQFDLPGTLQGTSVEGRLVSADGAPMKGLDVTLVMCGREGEDWKAVRSGDDGGFRFPDLAAGAYYVFVGEELGEQFTLQERIEVPAVPIFRPTITVASGALRGEVSSAATGAGLPRSVVILEIETQGKNGTEARFAGKTISDAQGRYEFLRLQPGRYRVAAYATSGRFGPEIRDGVDVPGVTLDFALEPGAALSIHVADASGRPVRGASIRFTSASGSSVVFSPDDVTDANGIFRAMGVKPGRWTVSVSHEPEGRAEVAIDLSAGEERTLELKLESNR
ncbi:MAG: carboxypeptidase regulatory-like domain-containing protein [Planctomycetota bacterium]